MKRTLLFLTAIVFAVSSVAQAAEPTVVRPFNGTNLDGWKFKTGDRENSWTVGRLRADATTFELLPMPAGPGPQARPAGNQIGQRFQQAAFVNMVGSDWRTAGRGVDIYTDATFGDCTIKLEFLITRGSNSGVYLMGEYEVQISDSFAKAPDAPLRQGDMGAIYSAAAPSRNAAGVPGTWQTYEIEFVAPRFDAAGNKTANALFKRVVLNGVLIQENVEVGGPTGGGLTMREAATGPLMLQGDHGPVAFRNIEIIIP